MAPGLTGHLPHRPETGCQTTAICSRIAPEGAAWMNSEEAAAAALGRRDLVRHDVRRVPGRLCAVPLRLPAWAAHPAHGGARGGRRAGPP